MHCIVSFNLIYMGSITSELVICMVKTMENRKKRIFGTCAILLLAVITIGGTLAYFTDEDEVTNVFSVGDLKIDLEEDWDPEDGENMVPGDTVVKEPVTTALSGNGYLRMIVTIEDNNEGVAEGTKVTDEARLAKILSTLYFDSTGTNIIAGQKYSADDLAALTAGGSVTNPVNTNAFILNSAADGVYEYYYINATLVDGKENIFEEGTQVQLFTNVVIPTNWAQEDLELLGKYSILIRAEAIQEKGFDNMTEAFAALDAQNASTTTP